MKRRDAFLCPPFATAAPPPTRGTLLAPPRDMRLLVVYRSTHGQTARIAERIAERLRGRDACVVVTGEPANATAAGFDAIIVGARVHGSRYPWRITRFIRTNLRTLTSRPSAFFSVSLLQLANDPAQRIETETLPKQRLEPLGWTPDRTAVFAGALLWKKQYGFLAPLFKRMWRQTLDTLIDPSLDEQVFTNWAEVDRFADDFLRLAMSRGEHVAESAPASVEARQ